MSLKSVEVVDSCLDAHRAPILLVEDDTYIAQLVVAELRDAGLAVVWCSDARAGLERFARGAVGLVILDLNLPDVDGTEVCERIRVSDRVTPILMLTARATRRDVVGGLEVGADDYLTKPFDSLELLARIRALLRRANVSRTSYVATAARQCLSWGGLSIDQTCRDVRLDGRSIELTVKEFDLLLLFARHPGRTFTRDELLGRVWGDGFEGYEHTVNTHINRLRNKVEKNPRHPLMIETVWGVGYRFASRLP